MEYEVPREAHLLDFTWIDHIHEVNERNTLRFETALAAYAANPDKKKPLPPTPPCVHTY
jgi:hypothetical protein